MRVKKESEKADLILNIKKTKIMASGPITSWQIEGKSGSSDRFYFLDSKITADTDCSHEIKRRSLLERKVMPNLGNILKSRDNTLPTKICREPPGCTQSVTRSWDEKGPCKAALPLEVVPGARYVPFVLLSYCCWAFY